MRAAQIPPLIFRVLQHEGGWSVEHDGLISDGSRAKAEAVAAATKRARAALTLGQPVQIRVQGETGYF
ncbi:MAG: DUF2188 domain-containing protein [Proteobacteria bacterium]|nr:DUF2188 domain-containing protein [Pseudomonadota bacterium]